MAARRHRRPDERDDEEERTESEEERPLDSGTVQSLREADPRSRAQAILQLQRQHGNAAVQRVIRSLQVTDASRDARVQMIGDRAEEPAPSGRMEKAALYRDAIEAELDAAPLAAKSERDLLLVLLLFAPVRTAACSCHSAPGSARGSARSPPRG